MRKSQLRTGRKAKKPASIRQIAGALQAFTEMLTDLADNTPGNTVPVPNIVVYGFAGLLDWAADQLHRQTQR